MHVVPVKPRRRRLTLVAGISVAVALAATACSSSSSGSSSSGSSAASDPHVTLRLADYLATTDPWTLWVEQFAKKVSADTKGAVTIKVYPNSELVSQANYLDSLRSGDVDMSNAGPTDLADLGTGALGLDVAVTPGLNTTWAQADSIANSAQALTMQNAVLKPFGVQILSTCLEGWSAFVSKTPVSSLSQLSGMKVRVAASADVTLTKALGGDPDVIPIGDTYEALQLGTVSGVLSNVGNIYTNQWYKVAKYVDLIPVRMSYQELAVNAKSWAKLSASEQQVVKKDATGTSQACNTAIETQSNSYTKTMQKAGAVIVQPSDLTAWKNATSSIRTSAYNASPLAKKLSSLYVHLVAGTKS
jgi:TRAP-type C4-dicarboxylate transport system substrate-binding protein